MSTVRIHSPLYEYDSRQGQDVISTQVLDIRRNKKRAITMTRADFENDDSLRGILQSNSILDSSDEEIQMTRPTDNSADVREGNDLILRVIRTT